MKAKYIFIIILLSVMTGYTILLSLKNNHSDTTDLSTDSERSKNLIDRFNVLRTQIGRPIIVHDTVIDNICKILLTDETKTFRRWTNYYIRDSVGLLLLKKGIPDYRYQIEEISYESMRADEEIKTFFVIGDKQSRAGSYRAGNRILLLKTEEIDRERAIIWKNSPDPFNQFTQIKYHLPETVGEAFLCIYDKKGYDFRGGKGKPLKEIVLMQRGEGAETISVHELALVPGEYVYALFVDGQQMMGRSMTVTENVDQNNSSVTTALPIEHNRSKNLIDRFNMLRVSENLPSIKHDGILDDIGRILLTDKDAMPNMSTGYQPGRIPVFRPAEYFSERMMRCAP